MSNQGNISNKIDERERIADILRTGYFGIAETRVVGKILSLLEESNEKAVAAYRDLISTNGRPLSGKPEVIEHSVPCEDCSSTHFADWFLYPHQVFNQTCTGGNGYLCLDCFCKRRLNNFISTNYTPNSEVIKRVEMLERGAKKLVTMSNAYINYLKADQRTKLKELKEITK